MIRTHLQVSNDLPRVEDGDQSAGTRSTYSVCEEIELNWWTATKLHERGWLSFNPQNTPSVGAACEAELRFVGELVVSGCDDAMLHHLLDGLRKPYRYSISEVYFDWAERRWRLLPGRGTSVSNSAQQKRVHGRPPYTEDEFEAVLELHIANASEEARLRLRRLFATLNRSGMRRDLDREIGTGRDPEIDAILARASPDHRVFQGTRRYSIFTAAWPGGIDRVLLSDGADDERWAGELTAAYFSYANRCGIAIPSEEDLPETDLGDALAHEFLDYIGAWRRRLIDVLTPRSVASAITAR